MFSHGLAGFLASSAVAEQIDLDGPLADRLRVRLKEEAIQAVRLEGELLRLAPLLDGFPVVVLKGAVLAHGAYPDPLLRPFTDLDLLVPGPRLEEFVVALAGYGYERSRPEPTPGLRRDVGKAVTLVASGRGRDRPAPDPGLRDPREPRSTSTRSWPIGSRLWWGR